jgi:hypothetical protein
MEWARIGTWMPHEKDVVGLVPQPVRPQFISQCRWEKDMSTVTILLALNADEWLIAPNITDP